VSIAKVVVLVTKNLAKLSLQFSKFSTIFLRFYKFQLFAYTSEDTLLHRGPYKDRKRYNHASGLQKNPQKEIGTRNVALGHGGGVAQPIPAWPAALPAVQGHGDKGMLT
jgi:hypothetical protein